MEIYKGDSNKGEIEVKKQNLQYSTPYFKFYQDDVVFPNATNGTYTRIEPHFGGVAILPMTKSGEVVLIRIFRHATRSYSLEVPRGFIDQGETPLLAAKREVLEEIKGVSEKWIYSGYITPDNSIMNLKVDLFIADGVAMEDEGNLLDAEAIHEYRLLTKQELTCLIVNNEIADSFTLALITKALLLNVI